MKRSLVLEINLAIAVTLLVIALLFGLGFFPHQQGDKERFIEGRLFFLKVFKEAEERTLIDPIFEKQWETLDLHLHRLTETDKIDAVAVYDVGGRLLTAFPEGALGEDLPEATLQELSKNSSGVSQEIVWKGEPFLFYDAPLQAIGDTIGFIRFATSLQEIVAAQRHSQIFFLALLGVLILTSIILLNVLMSRFVTHPLGDLVKTVKEVEKGNWKARAKKIRGDEIGLLNESFNHMIERLQTSFREIEKQNIDLKEMDRFKNEFLANVSHEIRTPLHAIIGFSEGMMEEARDAGQKKYLKMVLESATSLNTLVSQLLNFSHIKSGKIRLNEESFPIHKVVESVIPLIEKLIHDKPIRLQNEIPPDLPPVWGDSLRVQQIFLNLLENACKFTEKGTIVLGGRENGHLLEFRVSDTGIGIPKDKEGIIFEEFRQADGSTRRKYGGTGLGLTIVKQLVTLHGGTIWVESEEGKGTTFYFTLPKA